MKKIVKAGREQLGKGCKEKKDLDLTPTLVCRYFRAETWVRTS